ncbi:MAG: S41 family peptidase, partial [Myxococcota bacterium]|nr:S41 family peptidase [Myxococcota bacterium]
MARLLKHVFLLGLALPAGLLGYHMFAGWQAGNGNAATRALSDAVSGLTLGHGYDLSDLKLLQRDLWYVETRYVEKERIDPENMFQGALEFVEREVPEVNFQREPRGSRLHVEVGSYTTVLLLEPITSFVALTSQLRRVAAILEDHLSNEVALPEVEYAFINGALSTLDPHTVLIPPEAAREMEVDNQGEFGGLGIEITTRNGRLTVKQPLEGTPAAMAGLQSDDHIVRIEEESTINMDLSDAVSKLRGPVGAPVTIKIMRTGFDAPREFTIIRDRIRINPVEGELLEGDIGYVRIKNFHANVSSDLDALLARLARESGGKPRGLVLDLRANPGGYLNQAVDVSNKFLSRGVIVTTVEGGTGKRQEQKATSAGTEFAYPIAVLVNGSSASASEIVAGALRNQHRAIIVGERTFGKGSVQHLYANNDESRLKLTVAKYLTPGDQSIQSVGISPDILLQPSVILKAD